MTSPHPLTAGSAYGAMTPIEPSQPIPPGAVLWDGCMWIHSVRVGEICDCEGVYFTEDSNELLQRDRTVGPQVAAATGQGWPDTGRLHRQSAHPGGKCQ